MAGAAAALAGGLQMAHADTSPGSGTEIAKHSGLVLLSPAPDGFDHFSGFVSISAKDQSGTDVTLSAGGLQAGHTYVAHLHALPCDQENGGGHFKFDSAGLAEPPNEVHLMVEPDSEGNATATAHNDRNVGDGPRSLVLHMDGKRLACANW